ncbi:hypothetical protein AGDE_15054 [Angomonas deanei]|nr:hypothetical protein AGDE_15054 [Angomonas deanei]|eukprot:EPY19762.1 hypothetical protein AGDE_15054 [Angomonas deanei]
MKFERPLVIVLLVSTAVSFVFSLFAMAGSAALVAGKMKCGKSFCKSFTSAFESLESALGTQSENKYNCSIGASLPTIIVSFLLSLFAVVAAALLGLVYVKSSRMELLGKRRDQLVSLQNELNVKLGSLNASCAAPLEATSEDFSNHPDSFAYSNPSGFNESNLRPSTDDVNPQHLEETKINKLGGRIALFKQRRILEAEEQSRRETIMAEEERRFHMRERQFQLSHRLHNLEGQ